jgi:hypothetical protein
MTIERRIPAPPIHPLAALATVVLDGVFILPELNPVAIPILIPIVGILGFTATTLVQHFVEKEEWGPAIAKGFVMGIIAGVPYAVAGTVVGVPLLIWAGVSQFIRLPTGGNNQIVDEAIHGSLLEDKEKK